MNGTDAGGPDHALRFDAASVSYGRDTAVDGITGQVAAGTICGLLGPNGAGKSTLIKAVLGLLPVASGAIEVLGGPPARARRRVAYVPQADTVDPDFPVSAFQVVLMGRYRSVGWVRRPARADRDIAAEALATVGLADRAGHRFGALSGGQRQRVLLARAIAARPELLVLDEPFTGVDLVSQAALTGAVEAVRADGATILLSTHNLALARTTCQTVCLLNGRQYGFGTPGEVLTADRLAGAFGGHGLLLDGGVIIT